MADADDTPESGKVVLAARALIERYGDDAHERATMLMQQSDAKSFAAAVRDEVAIRLGRFPAQG